MRILLGCVVEPFHRRTCDLMHDWQLIHWMRIQHILLSDLRIYFNVCEAFVLSFSDSASSSLCPFHPQNKAMKKKEDIVLPWGNQNNKGLGEEYLLGFSIGLCFILFIFLSWSSCGRMTMAYITHGRCVHGCRHLSSSITRTWKCSIVSKIYLWEQMNI